MTMRSMTGFGEAERDAPGGRLRVEIRTVNHRSLNVQLRTPIGFDRHEPALEREVRRHFARGHVKITLTVGASERGSPSVAPDVERARAYVSAIRRLQRELELDGTVDVSFLGWFRDIFRDEEQSPTEVLEDDLLAVTAEAAVRAVEMREEEGARLAADLGERLEAMERSLAEIEQRAPARLLSERDRLRHAVLELLDGAAPVDEERIAREIAHLAERWDIHEETVRFRSHLAMFADTVSSGNEGGIGKRLGFIAQELLRETNTIGSKANDAGIVAAVVTLKEEIERLREQLENVE